MKNHLTLKDGRLMNLTGQQFGRLFVDRRAPNHNGRTRWWCVCKCGSERIARADKLIAGRVVSCGHCKQKNGTLWNV